MTNRRKIAFHAALTLLGSVVLWFVVRLYVDRGAPVRLRWAGEPIRLLDPSWLYVTTIIPVLYWIRTSSLTDLSLTQQLLGTTVRALVIASLAVGLARPSALGSESRVATVILIDVSASMSDAQLAEAQAYVDKAVAARKDPDRLDIVTFGLRARVLGPRSDGALRVIRHADEAPGTDITAALRLAYGLFPPGYLPRAVVISDGNETQGDLLAEAQVARDFGVRISFHGVRAEPVRDVRAVALRAPAKVQAGRTFFLTAEIWASHAEDVTVTLTQDGFANPLEPRQSVSLVPGRNLVKLKSEAVRAGMTNYALTFTGAKENLEKANDDLVLTVPVEGRPRILLVEGEYDRTPQAASYLSQALEKEEMDVEVRGPRGLPNSAKDLMPYDLVFVSDLAATFLGSGQMAALEGYVRELGGGLIVSGGENSFGSGGYQGTVMEKILPVKFEGEKERRQPRIALALVIDRSGSMAGQKIEMAKESARATAEILEPADLISVVAFDNRPTTVVRLQRASNRLRISTDISRIQPGGGTSILPALQEAYGILAAADAKVKHVILLSDGQAAYEGIAELCDEMQQARITVSAVGVGDADRALLQLIAERGEGRVYFADDAWELPKIFMQETQEVQKSSLVEETIGVRIAKRAELIEGTNVESAPPLRGYVSTKPKPTSEVILVSHMGEPLLARWRLGIGQVVAWTSDAKNRWATPWLTWGGFTKFWAQVVRSTMRHHDKQGYDLEATFDGGRARVVVDAIDRDDRFVSDLDTTLEVVDPKTSKVLERLPMELSAAGRYEAQVPLARYGSFLLRAVHRRGDAVVAESRGQIALPYPAEFSSVGPDLMALAQAATLTGGRADAPPQAVFENHGESIPTYRDLWPWVLLVAAGLFLVDVYLRRVRLFGYRPLQM